MTNILKTIMRKLSSRKFWMAAVVVVAGISAATGNDVTEMQSLIGFASAVIGGVSYLFVEGKCDVANAGKVMDGVSSIVDKIQNTPDN